jgi:hypothetical protein
MLATRSIDDIEDHRGGSATKLSVTGRCHRRSGDEASMRPSEPGVLANIAEGSDYCGGQHRNLSGIGDFACHRRTSTAEMDVAVGWMLTLQPQRPLSQRRPL